MFHWQNLSAENRPGAWPFHGRCWLHRGNSTYGLEWSTRRAMHLGLHTEEQGRALTFSVALLIFSLHLSIPCPKWFRRLLPLHHYHRPDGSASSWPEDREVGLRIHSGSIWWEIWCDPMEYGGLPRWRQGCFNPADFLLGRERCTTVEGDPVPVVVPMPEGSYAATVKREDREWKRTRWPRIRRRTDYWLEIPSGIPHMGKGENSWDCGTDGLFGCGGSTPEEAIGHAVASVMKNRNRNGSPPEILEADVRMAGSTG